jgi:hypothetical protein
VLTGAKIMYFFEILRVLLVKLPKKSAVFARNAERLRVGDRGFGPSKLYRENMGRECYPWDKYDLPQG